MFKSSTEVRNVFPDYIDLLQFRKAHQSDQTAFIFLKDGETEDGIFTYQTLDRRARQIALRLRGRVHAGERALLLYPSGLDFIAAFFGCLYAGVIAVPVYPPHPARPERTLPRLTAIAVDSGARFALTTASRLPHFHRAFGMVPELAPIEWITTDNIADEPAADWQKPALTPDDIAFLQYTSGSTGEPKGVMVSHSNLMRNEEGMHRAYGVEPQDICIGWLPLYHDMGLIGNVLQSMYSGIPYIFMSPMAFLQRPVRWLEAISRYRATSTGGPNFAYDLCTRRVSAGQKAMLDLSCWKIAFNGAEPISADTLDRFTESFAECGFRRETLFPCYGLAEATLMVSGSGKADPPTQVAVEADALARHQVVLLSAHEIRNRDILSTRLVGCGRSLSDQKISIVDPDTGKPLNPGEIGEIWTAGPHIAPGYWGKPELSEKTFRARPVPESGSSSDTWLRTGDLGFLWNKELFVTGRIKDLIIIRGRNHYPQDIEKTVQTAHPLIRPESCAAFSVDVDGEERVAVITEVERRFPGRGKRYESRRRYTELPEYVPGTDRPFKPGEVIDAVRTAVSEVHELQTYAVLLLKVGSIPRTSSGKIRRHACKDGFLDGSLDVVGGSVAGEWTQGESGTDFTPEAIPPSEIDSEPGRLEPAIRAVAAGVLKIAPAQISPERPLTGFGLDSLMAIELQHRLEQELGLVWPMSRFLQGPSTQELAREGGAHTAEASPLSTGTAEEGDPADGEAPLSYNQRSLWFLYKLAPESAAYHVFFSVRITSGLHVPALKAAFQALIDRHPALRTTYSESEGRPVQRVHETMPLLFSDIDAGPWPEDRLDAELFADAHRPFDLEKGPPLRVSLYRRSGEDILLLNIHHIAIDFWSFSILLDELRQVYQGAPLSPPPEFSYVDYVNRQERLLSGPDGNRPWRYWRNQLAGGLPPLDLPFDHPRPPMQRFTGASHGFELGRGLTRRIKSLAREREATPFMVLLAAFQTLLFRYTGQTDIPVGSPSAGRSRPEFAEVIGYFVNPLVFRADFSQDPVFLDFLSNTRQRVLEGLEYQDFPFPLLVERLQPERDPSRSPLFQVMFVLEKPHRMEAAAPLVIREKAAELNLGGLTLTAYPLTTRIAQFDLTLMMVEAEGRLLASFEYNSDLFETATVVRMADHFQTLLTAIADHPAQPVSQLTLLTNTEVIRLQDWNDTEVPLYLKQSVVDLIEEQAARNPDAVALVFDKTEIPFGELNIRANRIAHYLREVHRIGPNDRVGVLLDRSEWGVIALLGILKAAGVYVPVDPAYPAQRAGFMLSDSACRLILTEEAQMKFLADFQDRSRVVDIRAVDHANTRNPGLSLSQDQLSYMIYTSGSTGQPKGVMQTHSCLSNLIRWQIDRTGTGHRILQYAALGFDVSLQETLYSMASGSTLFIIPAELRYDMPTLSDYLRDHRIHMFTMPFSALNLLFREGIRTETPLRHVITSGEALQVFPELRNYLESHPEVRLHNQYGPTETHVVTAHTLSAEQGNIEEYPPIGRPISNTRIRILDAALQPVPVGVNGEILVGGANLAWGYLNREALTSEKFIDDPFLPGERLYRTGDVGHRLADGGIVYLGRNDDQVKIRGHRVELGEIENRLLQHPEITETVALAQPVDGTTELIAYIAGKADLKTDDLRTHLSEAVPAYMIPSRFIRVDRFFYTPNGKVDKNRLPDPSESALETGDAYLPPRNPVEEKLAAIWREVLNLERVGIRDDFFRLGGHSLKATQLISRIRRDMKIDVPLREVFAEPTIEHLAKFMERADTADFEPITREEAVRPASEAEMEALKKLLDPHSTRQSGENDPGENS